MLNFTIGDPKIDSANADRYIQSGILECSSAAVRFFCAQKILHVVCWNSEVILNGYFISWVQAFYFSSPIFCDVVVKSFAKFCDVGPLFLPITWYDIFVITWQDIFFAGYTAETLCDYLAGYLLYGYMLVPPYL